MTRRKGAEKKRWVTASQPSIEVRVGSMTLNLESPGLSLTEFEEILGYHLEQAYRYWSELGPLDEHAVDLGRRASARLASAGHRALARGDMPAAAGLLRRAAGTLPDGHRGRPGLLLQAGEALARAGITHTTIRTHPHADAGSGLRSLTADELAALDSLDSDWLYRWTLLCVAPPRALENNSRRRPISTLCSWGWRSVSVVLIV